MRPITQKTEKGRIITSRIPPPTDGVFCKALFCTGKRSEEHTSELQSRSDLVCRLLLEKKNTQPLPPRPRTIAPPTKRPMAPTRIAPVRTRMCWRLPRLPPKTHHALQSCQHHRPPSRRL